MRRRQFLLLLLLLTIGGVGGWAFQKYAITATPAEATAHRPQIASTDVDLANLKSLARTSCECEMQGGDAQKCNADFEAESERIFALIHGDQSGPFDASSMATACAPVSTENICFRFSDKEECFVTGYSINGASNRNGRQPVLCDAADAQAIERVSRDARLIDGVPVDQDNPTALRRAEERAQIAIDKTLDRILAGESQEYVSTFEEGCV